MRPNAVFLALLLIAAPGFAAGELTTGDIIAVPDGFGTVIQPPPPNVLTVYDADGRVKGTLSSPWGLFTSKPVTPAPNQIWFARYGFPAGAVLLSRDGRTLAGVFLRELNLSELTEVVPMRSGDLLVAEGGPSLLPRIVRFTQTGRVVSTWVLPAELYPFGAINIELLADQCTVVWVARFDAPWASKVPAERRRLVHTFNICSGEAGPDLMTLPFAEGAQIRQIPNGDFLVAPYRPYVSVTDLWRFSSSGVQLRLYASRVHSFALTPDGGGVWISSFNGERGRLQRIDFAAPDVFLADVPIPFFAPVIGVVGEWRASTQPARRRATGR